MSIAAAKPKQAGPSRKGAVALASAMIVLTLCVFTGAIWFFTHQLRDSLKGPILSRDAETLRIATMAAEVGLVDPEFPELTMGSLVEASGANTNTIAIRLFDGAGKGLDEFPPGQTRRRNLTVAELAQLIGGETVSDFHPAMDLRTQFERWGGSTAPVLQAIVPVKADGGPTIAYAEFLVSGEKVAQALAAVDHGLMRNVLLFGLAGGLVIALALGLAFYRLQHMNALLAERTEGLLRANHELALAAKTSAVGAVAAHLIHALKNPLFGIQMFVSCAQSDKIKPNETHWQAAANSAQRMQKMIADIVRILREDAGTTAYEVTIEELIQILQGKVATTAGDTGVKFEAVAEAEGVLPNREANLVALALTNLIQNAMQACKEGTVVRLRIYETDEAFAFEVKDQGPGLPEHVKKQLFSPTASGKSGGTGIGLAITKQLVSHMGGTAELVETGPQGTTFRLTLPTAAIREGQLAEAAAGLGS